MRFFILVILVGLISACVTVNTVDDADDSNSINAVTMSCKKPYVLSNDCSIWSGAKKSLVIDGFKVKVAGSEDGKIVLVMDAKTVTNLVFRDLLTLNNPTHSKKTNSSYHAIKQVFDNEGVVVNTVRPLKSFGNINGYVLLLDRDGYSLLDKFSEK